MEHVNGATLRGSHRAVFDVLRPIVHVLRASGFAEAQVRSAADEACRLYARSRTRGVWVDKDQLAEYVQLVMVWTRDPQFIDETGQPKRLSLADEAPDSFRALLRRAKCSVEPARALAQLRALGSVRLSDRRQRVRLLSNVVIAVTGERFAVGPALDSIRRFAETIEHNLCERRTSEGRMHRWAICHALDPEQFAEVQRYVRTNGQIFLEAVDEKLNSYAKPRGGRRSCPTYGVGVYVFVEEPPKARRGTVKRRRR